MTIEIISEETTVRTRGFGDLGKRELCATVASPELACDAAVFLRHVIECLNSGDTALRGGETLAYGYWLTKLVDIDDYLEAWEHKVDATEFVPGVTLTVTYWRDQHRVCELHRARFEPPRPDRLVVISAGVLEGDKDVQGIRYPSPEHMSGWWLTTSRFDGNTTSLKTIHAYHVTAARPDIAPLIALPYGFRFDLSQGEDVWFDENVAAETL